MPNKAKTVTTTSPTAKTGRPPKPLPEPIPATAESIMRALVDTPPKKRGGWKYLKTAKDAKRG